MVHIAARSGGGFRWLAGIMEVPISAEEKMATIEATERAKTAAGATEFSKNIGRSGDRRISGLFESGS